MQRIDDDALRAILSNTLFKLAVAVTVGRGTFRRIAALLLGTMAGAIAATKPGNA